MADRKGATAPGFEPPYIIRVVVTGEKFDRLTRRGQDSLLDSVARYANILANQLLSVEHRESGDG